MKCTCESIKLFNFGCRCGAFNKEHRRHVWFNGYDYVIARNEEEATKLLMDYSNFNREEAIADGWILHPDDEILTIWIGDPDSGETKMAWEWVKQYEKGFLASVT